MKDRLESVWNADSSSEFPPLAADTSTEICIVGGGISGLSTAYQLARRGHQVTVIEAFTIGSGQTGRTTAHLTTQLEEPFGALLKMHSEETIMKFIEAHRKAIDTIEQIIEIEGIQCEFKRLNGYLFKGKNFTDQDLLKEKEAGKRCSVSLDYISKTPLLKQTVPSLRFGKQAQFHPGKYIKGLVRVLKDLGVEIFENTHINDFRNDSLDSTILTTNAGYKINSRYVVVATDTPVNDRFKIHTKQFAYRTYAMTFELNSPQEEALLWDTEAPYHYVRLSGNKLIVGGEDHHTGQVPKHDPFDNLERWSRDNFSFLGEVHHRWSGQIFEPADQIAYIGKNPGMESNIFIVTGASGIGMTTATIASLLISDLIEEKENIWTSVFDPSRKPLGHLSEYLKENANIAYQYTDWLIPSEIKNEADLANDTGAVMREGLSRTCVYHESEEHFERKSAVCPHLGGIVHWNDIEKTWDCPCHGSRFNILGQVIEGPSLSNLAER